MKVSDVICNCANIVEGVKITIFNENNKIIFKKRYSSIIFKEADIMNLVIIFFKIMDDKSVEIYL